MNCVIYTRSMEPITVVDLPLWAIEQGGRQRFVKVAAMDAKANFYELPAIDAVMRTVTLEFHRLRNPAGNEHSWLITTGDEINALLLDPEWLPGQRKVINRKDESIRALSRVVLDAIARGVGGH